MGLTVILGTSIVLRLAAVVMSLRMIRVTGRWFGWTAMATAMLLLTAGGGVTMYHWMLKDAGPRPDPVVEGAAMAASGIIAVWLMWIGATRGGLGGCREALRTSRRHSAFARRDSDEDTECERAAESRPVERNLTMGILGAMPDGVCIVGEDHSVQYANPVIEREFGSVNGRKCYAYLDTRDSPCPWCRSPEVLAGKPVRWEWYSPRNERYYDMFDSPIRNPDGSVSKFGVLRDVTERRLAEDDLTKHRRHLEELVDQRTRELEESRDNLRRSERLASVGTFAAGIAHEINNPVGTIMLSAQNALRRIGQPDPLPDTVRALERILEDASRCGNMIKSVLRFSGRGQADRTPGDLAPVIARSVELSKQYADEHGVTIELCGPESLPHILMNPPEIEQALVNLLRNAVESGDGQSDVRIKVTAEPTPTAVCVRVANTGCGLTDHQQARLFDPFYTTRRTVGGTGLGLSIVHGIVTEHGGELDVRSELGYGTTIIILLPIAANTNGPGKHG